MDAATLFDPPEYAADIFPRSPLKTVVCQLRFDEDLRIATQDPVEFQDAVRSGFPRLTRQQGLQVVFGNSGAQAGTAIGWQFKNSDGKVALTLSSGALSLETSDYVDFPTFRGQLSLGLDALMKIYSPAPFTRIGLRYINEIHRPCAGQLRPDWTNWLRPELMNSAMTSQDRRLRSAATVLAVHYAHCTLNLRYGLAPIRTEESTGEALVFDADYVVEGEVESKGTLELLSRCNDTAYRVFRWSIGTELERRIRLPSDEVNDGTIFGNRSSNAS